MTTPAGHRPEEDVLDGLRDGGEDIVLDRRGQRVDRGRVELAAPHSPVRWPMCWIATSPLPLGTRTPSFGKAKGSLSCAHSLNTYRAACVARGVTAIARQGKKLRNPLELRGGEVGCGELGGDEVTGVPEAGATSMSIQ